MEKPASFLLPPVHDVMRSAFRARAWALGLGLGLVALTSGCVSKGYKVVKTVSPPSPLGLAAAQPPAEANLESVIIFEGPGSWKREAYWDEYVLTLTNRGVTPLTLESATLEDFQGTVNRPGSDPWLLEKQGKNWWQKLKSSQAGNLVALGAGSVFVATGFAFGAYLTAPWFATATSATSELLAGAAVGTLAAAPIYGVTVVVLNSKHKKEATAAFHQRRLPLPYTITPGHAVSGSYFFPISPAPRHLTLRFRAAGGEPFEIVMDLAPLSGLHMREKTAISGR